MILSYRKEIYQVPLKSKCLIHTTGTIRDGDIVSITSPVFASMNYTSGAINTSDRFEVLIRIPDKEEIHMNNEFYGILNCYDNDTFSMYVSIQ